MKITTPPKYVNVRLLLTADVDNIDRTVLEEPFADQIIHYLSNNESTYSDLLNEIYNLNKSESIDINELSDIISEILLYLESENMISLLSMSSDINSVNAEISLNETPAKSARNHTNSIKLNNLQSTATDISDLCECDMRLDLSDFGVDYGYAFAIKNGFAINRIGDYYYIMPCNENDTSRYYIKTNEVGMTAVSCFSSPANFDIIYNKLRQTYPSSTEDECRECARYTYNKLWFELGIYETLNNSSEVNHHEYL